MVTCLATRPHWLLASTIPFSRSRCPTTQPIQAGVPRVEGPQAPSRHSPLASVGAAQVSEDLWAGPARGVRVNASGASTRGGPRIIWAECRTCKPYRRNFRTHRASIAAHGIQWHEAQGPQAPAQGRHPPGAGLRPPPGTACGGRELGHPGQGRHVLDRHRADRGPRGRLRSPASPSSSRQASSRPVRVRPEAGPVPAPQLEELAVDVGRRQRRDRRR